jgi:hypothetical protein
MGGAVAALVDRQPARFDIPVIGGDVPAGRQLGLAFADLPPQGCGGVLQDQGGGAAGERDRDWLGYRGCGWWRDAHCSNSMIAAFWRVSHRAAAGPVMTRTFHLTFSPPEVFVSSILYA